jgi:hypothetical protein
MDLLAQKSIRVELENSYYNDPRVHPKTNWLGGSSQALVVLHQVVRAASGRHFR